MDLGLGDATVCVQGGSKGMGRAAAECFAADGARVAVLARGQNAIDTTVASLTALGSPDAVGIATDATDPSSVEAAFAVLEARWGHLNALVCAAGPQVSQLPWEQVSDEQFDAAYDIGTIAPIRLARAALPMLRRAPWARIVNVSAMSARSQGHGLIEYTAAKAALNSVTKNLSLELAPDGILCNVVSPGTFISDQMVDYIATLPPEAGVSADDTVSVMRYISEHFHVRADLNRAGRPEEIGPVICFLASQRNTYITGANLNVDGGSAFYV